VGARGRADPVLLWLRSPGLLPFVARPRRHRPRAAPL